jgi:transcriptional regulator with XRE-family HTH domain
MDSNMTNTPNQRRVHQGRNIKKFREMLGIKQEALAIELGDDWSQKKISQLEAKEVIDDAILEQVSQALKIPKETLENLDAHEAVINIQNNYENHDHTVNTQVANQYNVNPEEQWMKALAEVQRLNEENKALYERLLKSEQDKVALLEAVLKERK